MGKGEGVCGGEGGMREVSFEVFGWAIGLILDLFRSVDAAGLAGLLSVPFVPLYTRLRREHLLDHDQRKSIFEMVRGEPGVNFSGLMNKLCMKNGVLAYHLMTLEREGFITSRRDGVFRRYYLIDAGSIPDEIEEEIVEILYKSPGISQSGLARHLNKSRQVINYHIKQMASDGFVRLVKTGRRSRCYLQNWVS